MNELCNALANNDFTLVVMGEPRIEVAFDCREGNQIRMLFPCRTEREESVTARLSCHDVVDYAICRILGYESGGPRLRVLREHPVLWKFQDSHRVHVRATRADVQRLLPEFQAALRRFLGYEDGEDSGEPDVELLNREFVTDRTRILVAEGPGPLMQAYADVLRTHGFATDCVHRPGSAYGGGEDDLYYDVRRGAPLLLVLWHNCSIIAHDLTLEFPSLPELLKSAKS